MKITKSMVNEVLSCLNNGELEYLISAAKKELKLSKLAIKDGDEKAGTIFG